MTFDKELLEILVCPRCKGVMQITEAEDGLICETCQLLYPIREGIPIMLADEAQDLGKLKKD